MNRYIVADLEHNVLYNTNDLKYIIDEESFDRYGSSVACIDKDDLLDEINLCFNDGQLKNCTIVCVDTDVNSDSPVIVQNYGLMTKKQAIEKLKEIYKQEQEQLVDVNIEYGDSYVGVYFDNDYEGSLNRREYYLQELEVL